MWAKQADTRAAKLYSTSNAQPRANALPAVVYGLCYGIMMLTYLERYRKGEYVDGNHAPRAAQCRAVDSAT
jgi:hypothetical protein